MSYKDNVIRTHLEMAWSRNRQGDYGRWWENGKPSKRALQDKLLRYSRLAGKNLHDYFDGNFDMVKLGVGFGWASKRTKAKLIERGQPDVGRKPRKVDRRIKNIVMLLMWLPNAVQRLKIVPTLPEGGFNASDAHTVIYLTNHKKGMLKFLDVDGSPLIDIPFVQDKTKTEDELVAAWDGLKRTAYKGNIVPFVRKRMWKTVDPTPTNQETPSV